ncbi:MAG: SPOR domain-containing protein, partial [Bacteroidota bacterium]
VVNYGDNSLSKIDAENMFLLETEKTAEKPIGITLDEEKKLIWVACYTGVIQVFEDLEYKQGLISENRKETNFNAKFKRKGKSSRARNNASFYYVPRKKELKDPTYYVYREKKESLEEKEATETKSSPNQALPKQISSSKRTPKKENRAQAENLFTNRARFKGSFYVIVGSYQNNKFAKQKAQELRKDGYDTLVLPNEQGGFRVSAGQYSDKSAADDAALEFKNKTGIKAWILKES